MKSTATIQHPAFFNPAQSLTANWARNKARTIRPAAPHVPLRFALNTDDLAATKQEVVCCSILGLCLLYTLGHVVAQMAL